MSIGTDVEVWDGGSKACESRFSLVFAIMVGYLEVVHA